MHDDIKARSAAIWGTGDYGPASRQLEPAAVALVEALGIGPGMRVLDVASGHGNCAIAAARAGASVVASDFSPRMIEIGSARTAAAGLDIAWQEADAADLPFEDASFDCVTSTFGAIFAPEQEAVGTEAVRVVRPGGMIGLTAWTADGMTARTLAVAREYGPPRPGDAPDPFLWGMPEVVQALFEPLGCSVRTRRRALTFRYASWAQWRADSEAHGMAVVAKQSMPPADFDAMRDRMRDITAEYNYGEGDAVVFDADYLEIIVTTPAEAAA